LKTIIDAFTAKKTSSGDEAFNQAQGELAGK
jgi:hypothetical protein